MLMEKVKERSYCCLMNIDYFSISNNKDKMFKTLSKLYDDYVIVRETDESICPHCGYVSGNRMINKKDLKYLTNVCEKCYNVYKK